MRTTFSPLLVSLTLAACNAGDLGGTAGGGAGSADDGSTGANPEILSTPMPACDPDADEPPADTDVVSVKSGRWFDPSTWNTGRVPIAGDDVAIRRCHVVTYDAESDEAIRSILVTGKLELANDTSTRLVVGVLVATNNPTLDVDDACYAGGLAAHGAHHGAADDPYAGTVAAGEPSRPVAADVRAVIRLAPWPDQDASCAPGLFAHAGRIDLHGAPLGRAWTEIAETATAGATAVVVQGDVRWNVGDRIIVTGTDDDGQGRDPGQRMIDGTLGVQTEERIVTAIDGATLHFAEPLVHEHWGGGWPGDPARDLRGEVANLSRNVVVESADPAGARGHTMFHAGSSGSISWAEFRELGKEGVLGRYPVHFHLAKDTMRGSSVIGASIWASKNRWLTIHGSEHLVVRDTVGYRSYGHGYFLEDGSEVYNLFDRSLGVQAMITDPIDGQVLAYDQNRGAGYWAANARNFVTRNTYVECDNDMSFILEYEPGYVAMPVETLQPDGTRKVVDVDKMSGGLVADLEVHTQRGWGPWLSGGDFPEDEPMLFKNLKSWNVHYSIDVSGRNVVVDGAEVFDSSYGFYNNFPGPHVVRNAYLDRVGPHGAFMTYRGGGGTQYYEDVATKDCDLVFRPDAVNGGDPITIHARNVRVMPGERTVHWAGTEDANSRPDPLLMLVVHDLFGAGDDAVVIPGTQSTSLPGVPDGLSFTDGAQTTDATGMDFAGRGATHVAHADLAWPDAPILHPVDRVPPATVIVSPSPGEWVAAPSGTLTVRGVVLDQNGVAEVSVMGVPATLDPNGIDWSVTLTGVPAGGVRLEAFATDHAGNVERMRHATTVWVTDAR